jgi:hypothetical protein
VANQEEGSRGLGEEYFSGWNEFRNDEKYSTLSRVLLAKLPHHFVAFDVCGSKNFPVPFVYLPWSMRKVAAQLGMV